MINLKLKTAPEIGKDLSERIANIRKRRRITQQELAVRSGVSFGSVKRFEQTGEISLLSLSKIAIALEIENELETLFTDVPYRTIDEVLREKH